MRKVFFLILGSLIFSSLTILSGRLAETVYADTCSNGTKNVGETWPECHGCDEGVVTCTGQDQYGWQSVKNPSSNCGSSCGSSPATSGDTCPIMTCRYSEQTNSCPSGLQWVTGTGCSGDNCTGCNYVGGCSGTSCISAVSPAPSLPSTVQTCKGSKSLTDLINELKSKSVGYNGSFTDTNQMVDAYNKAACPDNAIVCGHSKSWADIDSELKGVRYSGKFDHSQQEIKDYENAACPNSTSSPSPSSAATGFTCTVSGPASVVRGSKAKYTAATTDSRVKTLEIYYNFTDLAGPGWNKIANCRTSNVGGCSGELDTSKIPDDKGEVRVVCNAYTYDSDDPTHTDPGISPATACTGNPIVPRTDWPQWVSCGDNSHKTVSLTTPVFTVLYRIAESPADFAETGPTGWQPYTADGMTIPYDFKTPGSKFIFVQFKDSKGTVSCGDKGTYCSVPIKVLGPNPTVPSCSLNFEGDNAIMTLTGSNFGVVKGSVKRNDVSDNNDLEIRSWKDNTVVAVWPTVPVGQTLSFTLTNSDGQEEPGNCSAISQLSVGAKVFCSQPSAHNVDNVDLILAGAFAGGTKIKQKVSIDKKGVIQGLNAKLEAGKQYILSLKATKSLRRNVLFKVADGTTNISGLILPVGDIFPLESGDGHINSFDHDELVREWTIAGDATGRAGDFNQDGKVNSIDWACMRTSMPNAVSGDDPEPEPGVPAASLPAGSNISLGVGNSPPNTGSLNVNGK